jgi:hypothetical protein
MSADFLPGDQEAAPGDQQGQQARGLWRQIQHLSVPPKLPGPLIENERAERDGSLTYR